jgi:hypothetical protein
MVEITREGSQYIIVGITSCRGGCSSGEEWGHFNWKIEIGMEGWKVADGSMQIVREKIGPC